MNENAVFQIVILIETAFDLLRKILTIIKEKEVQNIDEIIEKLEKARLRSSEDIIKEADEVSK